MKECPKCGGECHRDDVDVGVGIIYGPWGCMSCGWSEDPAYDLTEKPDGPDERGGYIDQYGGYYPAGSRYATIRRKVDGDRP